MDEEENIESSTENVESTTGVDAVPGGESVSSDAKLEADPAPVEIEEEPVVQIGEEKFTASQITEAMEIKKNQADFTTKNQAEAARLNTLSDVLEKFRQGPIDQPVEAPQSDVLSPDDAVKWQETLLSDNPREAITQLVNFIEAKVSASTTEQKTESAFMTAHPDYLTVINSPDFKAFKASNPLAQQLHVVNAYYEFTASKVGDATTDAIAAGVKKGEEKANAHAAAKANLTVLNSGGIQVPVQVPITPDTPHSDVLNQATEAIIRSRQNE